MDASRVVALGEHGQTWANVGSDGGLNVAIWDMSCPVVWGSELYDLYMWAGLQLWMGVAANRVGDTGITSDRGSRLANAYVANGQNAVVANGWIGVLFSETQGPGCLATSGMHPGTGINGCGTYFAISEGATATEAQNLSNSTWAQVQDNARDATGSSWAYEWRFCNYDCATYPPILSP